MAKASYFEQLKDPRWQKKRLEILERDNWRCKNCGDEENELQIHHLVYNETPWTVSNEDLVTLCKDCHEAESERYRLITKDLRRGMNENRCLSDSLISVRSGIDKLSDRGLDHEFFCIIHILSSKDVEKEDFKNIFEALYGKYVRGEDA